MLLWFQEWRLLFIPWIVANGIEVLYDISMDAYLLQLGTVSERGKRDLRFLGPENFQIRLNGFCGGSGLFYGLNCICTGERPPTGLKGYAQTMSATDRETR